MAFTSGAVVNLDLHEMLLKMEECLKLEEENRKLRAKKEARNVGGAPSEDAKATEQEVARAEFGHEGEAQHLQ
ncbi:hypothetical protein R1flu_010612 [Riccia fluitans]|uniref:Uncharacterized protein n=1 Tax=Riccia fluitans TaxID=41844 RepID=A0ABD1Z683_9MARC